MLLLKVSEEPKATSVKALTSTMPKANRPITPFFFMPPQLLDLNFVEIFNLAISDT
jgi:hypothetical protein